jgi:type IV pilus assembly protein PilM
MPKGLIANDSILDGEALAMLVEHNLMHPQVGRISTNRVVASIPEPKSFIRVITIPQMTEAQAENAVLFEAEAYIPMPMDQVYFDWQIIGRKDGKLEVLIIASPKEFVDKLIDVLEQAKLKLVALEVESQAVVRALVPPASQGAAVIADLDAFKTALIMVDHGSLQFTSSVPIAGNAFTDRMAQALSLPLAQAEALKRKIGITSTPEHPNLKTYLLPVVHDLAAEIKNILKFHYDHSEEKVPRLVLSGGSSKLKHLDELLQAELGDFPDLKIEIGNPLLRFGQGNTLGLDAYEALSFTTAIGLALRGSE